MGFAWDPFGKGKTSIRAGFGVFYDVLLAQDNQYQNGTPPFHSAAFIPFSSVGNSSGWAGDFLVGSLRNHWDDESLPFKADIEEYKLRYRGIPAVWSEQRFHRPAPADALYSAIQLQHPTADREWLGI